MNWNNYLLEEKSPMGHYAHLGVLEGMVKGIYDLATLPEKTKFLDMTTPLKKFNLSYTNLSSLKNHPNIEAIRLTEFHDEWLAVLSTIPNLKYLKIGVNNQPEIPKLSPLKNLEILIISGLTKVEEADFVFGLPQLKTLYIYGMNNLYDLTPLSSLTQLEELYLDHGKMSGTGKAIKSMEPISKLTNLKYLAFKLNVENKNYDIQSLLTLKKLQKLNILPRYLKKGQREELLSALPLLKEL